ncbi:hypothetical protein [Idiomarina abyssalis]|uniref:Uncharacterized protein n=2 Tax=Idiomarina abyssalis TaxID=86102 RepID=A0ABS0Z0R9_9GAMM|nr:hypothetical protein [Idiomarina abyssalis]KPD21810.1 hypothetical protein ADS78_04980 [Idiomarina abyssalis]MBJ7266287.1 hypothetical protein [Idiomarina abyssalis]
MSLMSKAKELSPAYFGLVMATGIIAIAAHQQQWPSAFFYIALLAWGVTFIGLCRSLLRLRQQK